LCYKKVGVIEESSADQTGIPAIDGYEIKRTTYMNSRANVLYCYK
jgi:hypothetical protein